MVLAVADLVVPAGNVMCTVESLNAWRLFVSQVASHTGPSIPKLNLLRSVACRSNQQFYAVKNDDMPLDNKINCQNCLVCSFCLCSLQSF